MSRIYIDPATRTRYVVSRVYAHVPPSSPLLTRLIARVPQWEVESCTVRGKVTLQYFRTPWAARNHR